MKTYVPDMTELKLLAYRKGLTFNRLAAKAHISTATLYSFQMHRCRATMKTLKKIADALGITVAEIPMEEEKK